MNANELAGVLEGMTTGWFVNDWKLLSDSATMLRQQQAKIAEQERTIKCKRIHIRELEMVTYWLVENRPEVWEDIRKWAENERK